MSKNELKQILKEWNHISGSHRSCIDLIFTREPSLSMGTDIHLSSQENCHHLIIYSKSDLKIFYPPPHERTIRRYKHTNTYLTKKGINNFGFKEPFEGCDLNKQVNILTDTVFNIMSILYIAKLYKAMVETHLGLTRKSKV